MVVVSMFVVVVCVIHCMVIIIVIDICCKSRPGCSVVVLIFALTIVVMRTVLLGTPAVVITLIILFCCLDNVGARGRTSSLNKVPEPEPELPVEEKDIDPSGCQYMGKFQPDPDMPGHGKEISDWGKTVYNGGFRNCLYHGEGEKVYADGRVYDGQWVDGKPHGVGKFKFSNGQWHNSCTSYCVMLVILRCFA